MPDFGKTQIIWGGGHSLDRSDERSKPPDEVERVIRYSEHQIPGRKPGRWEIIGCIGSEVTRVVVQESGNELIVVTVYGEGKRCN